MPNADINESTILFNQGIAYVLIDDIERAQNTFLKILENLPDYGPAYFGIGCIYAVQGRREDAIKAWLRCVQLDPNYGEAYYTLAWAFYDIGDTVRGYEFANKALGTGVSLDSVKGLIDKFVGTKKLVEEDLTAEINGKPEVVDDEVLVPPVKTTLTEGQSIEPAIVESGATVQSRIISWVIQNRTHISYLGFVFTYTLILGLALHAWVPWSYTHAGYDTLKHMYKTNFIIDNWPFAQWNNQWAAGMPFNVTYTPFMYYLMSLIVFITRISIEQSYVLILIFGSFFLGLGIYGTIFEITGDKKTSFFTSLLVTSTPLYWRYIVVYGMGMDYLGISFSSISIWIIIKYIKVSNEHTTYRNPYLYLSIISCAIAVSFHSLIGTVNTALCCLMAFIGVKYFNHKFQSFLTISFLTFLTSGYYFFRLLSQKNVFLGWFKSTSSAAENTIGIFNRVEPIISFSRNLTSKSIHFLSVPLLIALFLIYIYTWRKGYVEKSIIREQNSHILFFGVNSIVILLTTILEIPLYGYVFELFPLYISLLIGVLLFYVLRMLPSRYGRQLSSIPVVLILLILVSTFLFSGLNVPSRIQQLTSMDPKKEGEFSIPEGDDYRVGFSEHDGQLALWYNYRYDTPQTRHYASGDRPYPKWEYLASTRIWDISSNYDETNFLLGWWGVKWIVARPETGLSKFEAREDIYEFQEESGAYKVFENVGASPIVSVERSPTLLVIGGENYYDYVFRSLSFSDIDTKEVIPIRGGEDVGEYSLEELMQFDSIMLYGYDFKDEVESWQLISRYVEQGGGLLIESADPDVTSNYPLPSPVAEGHLSRVEGQWNFTTMDSNVTQDINLNLFSPPSWNTHPWKYSGTSSTTVREGAQTLLWVEDNPVLVYMRYGKGTVLWSGLNLPFHIREYGNVVESAFFGNLIKNIQSYSVVNAEVNYNVQRIHPQKLEITLEAEGKLSVLFREYYVGNWKCNIETENAEHKLNIYAAGPDFMYVQYHNEGEEPAKITFSYTLNGLERLGYGVTPILLLYLASNIVPISIGDMIRRIYRTYVARAN